MTPPPLSLARAARFVVGVGVVVVVVACSACGISDDGFFFEGEGEGFGNVIRAEKRVTLHLDAGGPLQRFDVDVETDAAVFSAAATVDVDAASGVFSFSFGSSDTVDDPFSYGVFDVGSSGAIGLGLEDGIESFAFGAGAGEFDADVDLVIGVSAEVEDTEARIALSPLRPRLQ